MPLRTVNATRYITPLREGGSLPAIVEADDESTYVLKFRGAGQGVRVLVAQVPDAWLGDVPQFTDLAAHREAYASYLNNRLQSPRAFVEEAIRAHACL